MSLTSKNIDKKEYTLFFSVLFTFIVGFSPFKFLAYLMPFIVFILFLRRGISKIRVINFLKIFLLLVLIIPLYYINNYISNSRFLFFNLILSVLTYSSFIVLYFVPTINFDNNSYFYYRLIKTLKYILIIEIVVGYIQILISSILNGFSLDLAAGDIIQGTINLLSFWHSELGFNNPIFLCNLIFIILFISPYLLVNKKYFLVIFSVLLILLASSIHIIICLIFAAFAVFLIFGFLKNVKYFFIVFVFLLILILLLAKTQPTNFYLFQTYFTQIFLENTSPKVIALLTSIFNISKDHINIFIFGLGPGQYTSRASLIASGHFFGSFDNPINIPFTGDGQINKLFKEYIYNLWETTEENVSFYGGSIMAKPFFSQLSVLIEFGLVGYFFLQFLFFYWVKKLKSLYYKATNQFQKNYIIIILVSSFYIYFLGFFENYWEVTQAIFPGLLLITLVYKNIKYQNLYENSSNT